MTRATVWCASKPRARVYLAVHAAGRAGLDRKAVQAAFEDIAERMVDAMLYLLAQGGHVNLVVAHGRRGLYRVDGSCRQPTLRHDDLLHLLMALISDCEAGVSETVLCQDLLTDPALVRQALVPAVAGNQVDLLCMPAAHGGGIGYRMAAAAVYATARATQGAAA